MQSLGVVRGLEHLRELLLFPPAATFGDSHPWQAGETEELAAEQIRWKLLLNGFNDVWKENVILEP